MVDTQQFQLQLETILSYTRENLTTIRTGRASPALIENVMVKAYGGSTTMRILEMATITTDGPQDLIVAPFDPSTTQDIESALRNAQMGFIVSVQGTIVRVKNPPLSTEQREKYAKLVSGFAEEGREKIRKARDEIRKEVKTTFDKKELSENDKRRVEDDIEKFSKSATEKIDVLKSAKQQEVMTV